MGKHTTLAATHTNTLGHKTGLVLALATAALVACGGPTPPKIITMEGSFQASQRSVPKCFPIGFTTTLKYGDTPSQDVRLEYDYDDNSGTFKTTKLETSHIFTSAKEHYVRVKAYIPTQTEPVYSNAAPVTVTQTERECTYIVGLKTNTTRKANAQQQSLQQQSTDIINSVGGTVVYTYDQVIQGVAAQLTPQAASKLEQNPNIEFIDRNAFFATSSTWNLNRVVRRERNESTSFDPNAYSGGKGVDVYVVDSGIQATHTEFDPTRIKQGFNAVNTNISDTSDSNTNSHGTHVAGIIAGKTTGIARRANIIPIKVFDGGDTVDAATLYRAFDEIAKRHTPGKTAIVNLSLSTINTPVDDKLGTDLRLEELVKKGLLLVIAAGNNSSPTQPYSACQFSPAKLGRTPATPTNPATNTNGVIVVGSSNSDDQPAIDTKTGECVDLFAPGVNIRSAIRGTNTDYGELSGTSMAAPHVAGLAALYLEQNPSAPPAQVEAEILQYATRDKLNFANRETFGAQNRLAFIAPELNKAGVQVSIAPQEITMEAGTIQDFTATTKNTTNTRVTWQFAGGTPTAEGQSTFRLTAPSTAGEYTLQARSTQDPDAFAQAKITVVAQLDRIKPETKLTTPNTTITTPGPVLLTATATDNNRVTKVEFWQNDTKLGEDYDDNNDQQYTHTLQLTDNDSGTRKIQAYAVDASNNRSDPSEVVLTINIPDATKPNIVLTGNTTSFVTAGQLTLTATATDNRGISKIEFYDGTTQIAEATHAACINAPCVLLVGINLPNNGTRIYTAKAFDAAGNQSTSSPWTVNVAIADVTPPTVALNTSNNDFRDEGEITLTATASDNPGGGVARVEFYRDETFLGNDDTEPYELKTTILEPMNGTRVFKAVAVDKSGNRNTANSSVVVQIWKGIKIFDVAGDIKYTDAIFDASENLMILGTEVINTNNSLLSKMPFLVTVEKNAGRKSLIQFQYPFVAEKVIYENGVFYLIGLQINNSIKKIVSISAKIETPYSSERIEIQQSTDSIVGFQKVNSVEYGTGNLYALSTTGSLTKFSFENQATCMNNSPALDKPLALIVEDQKIYGIFINTGSLFYRKVNSNCTFEDKVNILDANGTTGTFEGLENFEFKNLREWCAISSDRVATSLQGYFPYIALNGQFKSCHFTTKSLITVEKGTFTQVIHFDSYTTSGFDFSYGRPYLLPGDQTILKVLVDSTQNTYVIGKTNTDFVSNRPLIGKEALFVAKISPNGVIR